MDESHFKGKSQPPPAFKVAHLAAGGCFFELNSYVSMVLGRREEKQASRDDATAQRQKTTMIDESLYKHLVAPLRRCVKH